jgi:hypothetical protein
MPAPQHRKRQVQCGNQFELLGSSIYLAVSNKCPVNPGGRARLARGCCKVQTRLRLHRHARRAPRTRARWWIAGQCYATRPRPLPAAPRPADGSKRTFDKSGLPGITLYTSTNGASEFKAACLPVLIKVGVRGTGGLDRLPHRPRQPRRPPCRLVSAPLVASNRLLPVPAPLPLVASKPLVASQPSPPCPCPFAPAARGLRAARDPRRQGHRHHRRLPRAQHHDDDEGVCARAASDARRRLPRTRARTCLPRACLPRAWEPRMNTRPAGPPAPRPPDSPGLQRLQRRPPAPAVLPQPQLDLPPGRHQRGVRLHARGGRAGARRWGWGEP